MLFPRFLTIFPSFFKINFPAYRPDLYDSAWKCAFLMISDDFFQFHQIRQNVIFSLFLTGSSWFCLHQHENVFPTWFLMIFHNFIKKENMLFPRFSMFIPWFLEKKQKVISRRVDVICLNLKSCFSNNF